MKRNLDEYTDFLIEITTTLQNIGHGFDTQIIEPITGLTLDISLDNGKVAFMHVSLDECKMDPTSDTYSPLELLNIKAKFIEEQSGIRCIPIIYTSWSKKYPSVELQEDNISQSIKEALK